MRLTMCPRRKNAMVFIYCIVAILALMGFVSLAVDWGRVQEAKEELENATDAAARYAATGITDGTAASKAQTVAAQNFVDGTTLALLATDISVGTWDSVHKTFSIGGSSPNAVRVISHRSSARGTSIPLMFLMSLGTSTCDLSATSIATAAGAPVSYDVVGLNSVTLTGSGKINRNSSESGTVNVASNGTYSLSYGQTIAGNVLYRSTPPSPPSGCITGTMTAMASDIAFATPTTPSGCTSLNSANYGNGATYPMSGNYSATSLTIGGGCVMNLSGDVNIYCSGTINIGNGATINTNGTAYKFTIYQTTASTIALNMSSTFYVRIYAPLSTLNITGATPMIGSFVAQVVNISGSGSCSFSSALPIPIAGTSGASASGGNIDIVQ